MERPLAAAPSPIGSKLRLEIGELGVSLTRADGGLVAGLALAASYQGQRTIAIGFGGVRVVRPAAVTRLVRAAARLLEPWGCEARLELRCLRPAARRTVLAAVATQPDVAVTAIARRGVVVAPAADERLHADARLLGLTANRRRMLLLADRDGAHCVWCGKALTHTSPDATVDHVVCRSRGGPNTLENLVLSCAACNHRRADIPAEEFLDHCLDAGLDVDTTVVSAALRRAERERRRRRASREVSWPLAA